MSNSTIHVLGRIGPYSIFTVPDSKIEPGHQWIGINAGGIEAAFILSVLTDSEPHTSQETAVIDGLYCRVAPHNAEADRRLCDLVDLCADLRFSAPQIIQIAIEGLEFDEHT